MKPKSLIVLLSLTFVGVNAQTNFTVSPVNNTGTYTITCATPSINLMASCNYTAGSVTYVWNTPTGNVTGSVLITAAAGNYSLVGTAGSSVYTASFAVASNTIGPAINLNPTFIILNCNTPTQTIQASSSTSNAQFLWQFSNPTGSVTSSSMVVSSNTAQPTNTLVGNYSLTVTDPNNACTTKTVVPVFQNLFPPKALISAGIGTLTCQSQTLTLVNQSSSGIPPGGLFPPGGPVQGYQWFGPNSQPSLAISSTYTVASAGLYTLVVKDLSNGCMSTTVITILDFRDFPQVQQPQGYYVILCPNGTVQLAPSIVQNPNYTYLWTVPSSATVIPINQPSLVANAPGAYSLTVTNSLTGCASTVTMSVWACLGVGDNQLNAPVQVYPNPGHGTYALQLPAGTESAQVDVLSITGERVYSIQTTTNHCEIDLAGQANGVYILQVSGSWGHLPPLKLLKQ